jgi:putative endopeptidase
MPTPRRWSRATADYVRKILVLTGIPAKELERETALVLDLETAHRRQRAAAGRAARPEDNYAPVATTGLGKQYRNLQLDAFLRAQGVSDDAVSIANPAMFAQLDALVGSLKPAQWKTYLRWRVGDAMAPYLAKPWRDASFAFRGKVLLGQAEPAPRWQQTLDAINLAAGPMLGREYAARYLPDATRQPGGGHRRPRCATHCRAMSSNSTWLGEAAKPKRAKKIGKLKHRDRHAEARPRLQRATDGPRQLRQQHADRLDLAPSRGNEADRSSGNADRRWDVLPQQPALAYDLAHNR